MLTHAFEVWSTLRVCLHTDARNTRSATAIERIGGQSKASFAPIGSPPTVPYATPCASRYWTTSGLLLGKSAPDRASHVTGAYRHHAGAAQRIL